MSFSALLLGIIDAYVNSPWWLICFFLYNIVVTGYLAHSIALHRYFVHRAFKTTAFKHKILLALSIIPGCGGPISFAILHRHHHKHSDQELDTHRPVEGFFHTWILYSLKDADWFKNQKKVNNIAKDLYREPGARWVQKNYFLIFSIAVLMSFLIDWRITVYFVLAPVAGNFLNNILLSYTSHIKRFPGNYRNFNTTDDSHNNFLVSWLYGDLHNNHHQSPSAHYEAVKEGEYDPPGWIIERFFIERDPNKQYIF
jgi:stearoyl-CoA desaturase (delta-9 desaturase)